MNRKLRCLFRRHQWRNSWDAENHETVWTCKRCGLIRTEIERMHDSFGGGAGTPGGGGGL
jgi:hypothetical protein